MPAVILTIASGIGSALLNMVMKVIAGPALEKLILEALSILVERTDSKADDKLLAVVKEALEKK